MDVVILSFSDDNDQVTGYEAVVDTLDPIRAIIDDTDEPVVPDFDGCTLLDTSYGSSGSKNEFIVDYGIDDGVVVGPQAVETCLRDLLQRTYGITVKSFAPMTQEPPSSGLASPRPCR